MPRPGDIYTARNLRFDRCFAFQFTHHDDDDGHAVLLLDWWAQTPPDAAALPALKPAVLDFMGWNNQRELHWVGHDLPRDITHLGWREPMARGEVCSHDNWPDGACLQQQQAWNALDPAITRAYKQENARDRYDDTVILKGKGFSVARGASSLQGTAMNAAPALTLFDQMPVLTEVDIDVPVPGLMDWLKTRPLIHQLIISGTQEAVLDVRGTTLSRLSVDVTGMRAIHLNSGLDTLILRGTAHPDLVIHAAHGGRWLDVFCTDPGLHWSGLPDLQQITLHGMRQLDAARIAERLPGLRALTVQGAPCTLDNLPQLGELASLEHLELIDVFPPDDARFPAASQWPQLLSLSLDSVPATLATQVRQAFQARVDAGLALAVRQPRKAEWRAANLDNPFRDWEGAAHITPTQARKAVALYRKAHTDALKAVATLAGKPAALHKALAATGVAFTEGFNALDQRSGFIDTTACEDICSAWTRIVDAADSRHRDMRGASRATLDVDALGALIDSVRRF
ncbi:hypothetical protein [Stenotrophomonas sp. 24(2023)]|uniref:hypothetical protein n=1 Tax=Stenotrophomonas sp. 24(2023) TaxID=3068324 RepID=UPI0027DFCC12|nr:hypothetical protein [Stenotrophomonas sp. 24(2023)]WMJ69854.1 hypothetical protein Q9R17_01725 [Stenotrophomonas sp. 24(2023)]